jgi:hypothetical protein
MTPRYNRLARYLLTKFVALLLLLYLWFGYRRSSRTLRTVYRVVTAHERLQLPVHRLHTVVSNRRYQRHVVVRSHQGSHIVPELHIVLTQQTVRRPNSVKLPDYLHLLVLLPLLGLALHSLSNVVGNGIKGAMEEHTQVQPDFLQTTKLIYIYIPGSYFII